MTLYFCKIQYLQQLPHDGIHSLSPVSKEQRKLLFFSLIFKGLILTFRRQEQGIPLQGSQCTAYSNWRKAVAGSTDGLRESLICFNILCAVVSTGFKKSVVGNVAYDSTKSSHWSICSWLLIFISEKNEDVCIHS